MTNKKSLCVVLLLSLVLNAINTQAQERTSIKEQYADSIVSIFNHIDVIQSRDIRDLVGLSQSGENIEIVENKAYLKLPGYRTQVFSGNDQRKSKDEAFEKENEVKKLYPNLSTYISYTAPFWKLKVGDFRSREEAYTFMRRLMKDFPTFGKEMYIIKEEIRISLN